jgi:hypothetical protein
MKLKIENLKGIGANYYYIIFSLYALSLFFNFIRVGQIAAVYMTLIAVILLTVNIREKFKPDLLIFIYLIYNISSLLWFPIERLPYSVYFTEVAYSILPISFYFVNHNPGKDNFFLEKSMNAIFYSLVFGMVLYLWAPDFYGYYMYNHDMLGGNDDMSGGAGLSLIRSAFQSIYGVTAVGTFSTIIALYSFMKMIKGNKLKYGAWFILVLVTSFLSARRSAWLALIIVLVYFHYLLYIKWKKLSATYFLIEMILILAIISLMLVISASQLDIIVARFDSMSGAISERSTTWILGILATKDIYFGNGLGSMSHFSRIFGNSGVYDSSYVKSYAETGFIGISLLALILVRAIFKGVRGARKYYLELGIIIVFTFQAIGSNVFAFQVLAPIFWYSVGQCTRQRRIVSASLFR